MDIKQIATNNLTTFVNAYGLELPHLKEFVDDVCKGNGKIDSIGVLLRRPDSQKGLISCQFPLGHDVSDKMLWVMSNRTPLEAVTVCNKEIKKSFMASLLEKFKARTNAEDFFIINKGNFSLRVHPSLGIDGVIEEYNPSKRQGTIRRTTKGIFFRKEWTNMEQVTVGKEVRFIPVFSRTGRQARAVELI